MKSSTFDRCRHFNGIQHDTCRAGVSYDSVRIDGAPYRCHPCLCVEIETCDKRSMLTTDELRAEEAEMRQSVSRMLTAREEVVRAARGELGVRGSVQCPHCPGKIVYSIVSNGHIWAVCETTGCVRWGE